VSSDNPKRYFRLGIPIGMMAGCFAWVVASAFPNNIMLIIMAVFYGVLGIATMVGGAWLLY
jgi:hypothetical protein